MSTVKKKKDETKENEKKRIKENKKQNLKNCRNRSKPYTRKFNNCCVLVF